MTKQHLIALAENFKLDLEGTEPGSPERKAMLEIIDSVIGVARRFNGNFDRGRFLRACGLEA